MIKPVPDPIISAETNQRLPNSVTWSLTASRNSTKAKVGVATTSRDGELRHLQLIETTAFQ